MANDHQFQPINLCNNWWSNTVANTVAGFDYPPSFSCSTDQLLANFTANSSFSSDTPDVFDVKSTRSYDDSPGSASNTSSITLNDIPPYSSDPLLDFSLLSPTAMNWNQPFLSNDQAAENSLHSMLRDDTNQIQNNLVGSSSLNQVLLQDEQHGMNRDCNSIGLLASEQQLLHGLLVLETRTSFHENNQHQNGFHGRMNSQSQAVMDKVQQFTNDVAFWNPLASTAECSNLYHSMPDQLVQSDRNSISAKVIAKFQPNFGVSTSNSTSNKGIESEPVLKKPRIQTPSPLPTFKVRKEKLGDRVTALQQLVSPFGKTDTASVLHEAIDYIKFLHDQVRVLSAPYLKNGQQMQQLKGADIHNHSELNKQDLRNRGLCLVPISSTFPVATETPLDFWTPTFGASYM